MGVKVGGGPTLEIQLVADVARLQRDMADMKATIKSSTDSALSSFSGLGRGSAVAASQMAAAAQASARASVGMATGLKSVGASAMNSRIVTLEMFHVTKSLTEQLAMGVSPLRAFTSEIGRIGTAVQYSGGSVSNLVRNFADWLGILKVTRDAQLEEAAAMAAANAQAIKSIADRAAATLQSRQAQVALAEAQLAAADTAEAEAVAQSALVKALRAVEAQAGKTAIANDALATANAEAAAASEAAAARTVTSLGGMGVALGAVVLLGAPLIAAFAGAKSAAEGSDESLQKYIGSLGLTHKEIKKLKDEHVSWGDVGKATFDVLLARAGTTSKGIADGFSSAFQAIGNFGKFTIALLLAGFASLIELVMSLGKNIVFLLSGQFDKLTNPLADMKNRFFKTFNDVNAGFAKISAGADAYRDKRLKQQADEIIADRTAKKAHKEKEDAAAKELALLDKQIEGQWRLADAYKESDVAALEAEARLKAEEKALQKKGDVELFYAKELQLAVATRAAEGAKQIGDIRAQVGAQSVLNDQVEQGIVPVHQMGQALEELTKRRQLMAALGAAENHHWAEEVARLRGLIADLASSQNDLNAELARTAAIRALAGKDDEIAKLRLEAQLIRASNRERAVRLAQLEAENFLRDNNVTDPGQMAAIAKAYADAANGTVTLAEGQAAYNIELSATQDHLQLIANQTQILGQIMSEAFGSAGDAIGGIMAGLADWKAQEQVIADWKRDQLKTVAADSQAAADIEAQARQKSANAQMQAIGQTLSGLKSLFKEHSAGYRVMATIEKAYAILQTVNAIRAMALDKTKTASSIANSLARAAADGIAAIAKAIASLPFPLNIAAGAATAAALIAFGVKVFGGGGASAPAMPDIKDVQAAQGTGTVLGDNSAKSDSIANSLAIMAKNSTKGIDQTSAMVRSLRNIESGIGALTAAIARSLNLAGGFFDTTGKLGTNSSGGLFGIGGLFSSTTTNSLYDQGLSLNGGSLADIIAKGFSGATYQIIETVKKNSGFLGIGGSTSTSYSTTNGALDPTIARQFQLITANLYQSVVDAAKVLGFDVADALKQFQVQIGNISFKDLTGDEIQKQLEAVFSKLGDQMAGFAVANLAQYQKAGEGLYETLMRVAKDFATVGTALESIGEPEVKIAKLSIAAREGLIDLMGGLDEFTSQINYYYDNFLTTAEQTSFLKSQVDAAFASMGISTPATIDAFKALVAAQDLTTDAGQAMFAQLMAVAPAFYQLETAAQQAADAAAQAAAALAKQKTQLQIDLLNAQGKATEALAMQRQMELAAMDSSLRGLQQQVWAAQDLAKAKDNLLNAYKRESQEMQATIDRFRGFASDLRDFRASLFATSTGTNSYSQALVKLLQEGGLAAGGDEGALGGGLKDAAQSFLDIATANAGSLQDIARARALVARQLDAGIAGAEGQASLAQQQLDQLKSQVGVLIDINDNVQTVADALDAIAALLAPAAPSSGSGSGTAAGGHTPRAPKTKEEREHDHAVRTTLDRIHDAASRGASSSDRTAKLLDRVTKQGTALIVATDDDTPLLVDTSGIELA